jgi:hypothetical protein
VSILVCDVVFDLQCKSWVVSTEISCLKWNFLITLFLSSCQKMRKWSEIVRVKISVLMNIEKGICSEERIGGWWDIRSHIISIVVSENEEFSIFVSILVCDVVFDL